MTAQILNMRRSSIARLACTRCGAETDASCNCGEPYLPASTRAAKAIAENPQKSDRAIAADTGLGHATVSRARSSTVSDETVEKRTGLDGKARRLPKKAAEEMPTEEEAEKSYQATLYDQACLLLESMAGDTRQRFFAHLRRKYHVG